jgi:hypothetical protein
MIYLLNNIKFGHPKLNKYQLIWFDEYFIPLITKHKSEKIIIKGDLFYNNHHTTFNLISKVKHILHSFNIPIEIINNDYCFNIFSDVFTKINTNDYDGCDKSLFQFSKEDSSDVGFYIIKDKTILAPNKQTPKFIEYQINMIEDLNNVVINTDFIDILVNSELLENQQNKNKIDIFLNNNPTINVYYSSGENKQEEKVKLDSKNINIRNILINNIDEDLKSELSEIFEIYDSKKA